MNINGRFIWAVSVLAIKPDEQVLEIGCGAGILAEQIASKLSTGKVTAIDQSVPMIKLASKRNQAFLTTGKVEVKIGSFSKIQLPQAAYDKVVAFNVNIFWKDPAKALLLIRNCLKPAGRLFIFYQTPNGTDTKIAEQIKSQLQQYTFQLLEQVIYNPAHSASACCIIAVPG